MFASQPLASLGAAAIVLAALAGVHQLDASARTPREITILHTNDLHGHLHAWRGWEGPLLGRAVGGIDRLSTEVDAIRTQRGAEQVLLLDAGDTIGDTMIAMDVAVGGQPLDPGRAYAVATTPCSPRAGTTIGRFSTPRTGVNSRGPTSSPW